MQNLVKTSLLLALAVGSAALVAAAEEAVVNEGKINVRGQPSLIGEVVTQLQRGEKVQVLDRIKIENPKPGDPETWAKIKLPQNVPVWVFSPFVKDGVVSANRLNLRGGPGENYSVIGRIDRGTTVKSIRTIEEWMEIEAPDEAYAFVDASLLKSTSPETVAAPVAAAAAVPATQTPATNQPPALTQETTPSELQPAIIETTPAPIVAAPPAAATTITPAAPQSLPEVAPPPAVKPEPARSKRIVRREGIIRPTKSIQAPTWYELIHPETKAVINYLHEEKLGVNLKGYRGQKVIVSGEEAVDPRWPNTPIMELESLDFAP